MQEYQLRAVRHLLTHDRAGLFLDPGLGKHAITLAAIDALKKPVLILASQRACKLSWPEAATVRAWNSPDWQDQLIHFPIRWLIAGPPDYDKLEELWAKIYLLDDGEALGRSLDEFHRTYYDIPEYNNFTMMPKKGAREAIHAAVAPYIFSLTDYSDLPAVITHQVRGDKIESLQELREELGPKPALIFYNHADDLDRLCSVLGGDNVAGPGVSSTRIWYLIREFNHGRLPWLLVHPAMSGHGFELKGLSHVIWFSLPLDQVLYDHAMRLICKTKLIVHHLLEA